MKDSKQSKGKDRIDALVAAAVEAEADLDRHHMEEAILAAVAKAGPNDSTGLNLLTSIVTGKISFRSDLQAIAQALYRLYDKRIAADKLIIRDELKAAKTTVQDEVLHSILDGSTAKDISVAEEYVRKLERQDRFRQAEAVGRRYLSMIEQAKTEDGDIDQIFGNMTKTLFDLAQSKKLVAEYPTEGAEMPGFMQSLAKRRDDGRAFIGLDSGFNHLNHVFNGLTEGVYVFAGAPSCGKTTLLKQIADHVAEKEQIPVLFWSFEQSKEELRIKSLSRLSQVDSRQIWKGCAAGNDWKKVEDEAGKFSLGSGRFLQVIEAGREDTLDRIRTAALMAKHKAGDKPILVVIDYLQIIPSDAKQSDSIREKVDWNLSELRRLARDIKSPVLVISSQNRQSYTGNEKPSLTALKESGGIEYSADAVICLWRDKDETDRLNRDLQNRDSKTPNQVRIELYVLKNRNGELAKIKLDFTPAYAEFANESKPEELSFTDALGRG